MLQLPFPTHAVVRADAATNKHPEWPLRLLDMLLSATLLIALAPLLLLASLAIFAGDGAAPWFVQHRLGRGGRAFPCLKLRTMAVDSDRRLARLLAAQPAARVAWQRHRKLARDPRVTRLGRLLRRTSIDELPQLLNVLIGDMSLVGPRPIVAGEVGRYGRRFASYCRRRPGLTGLWQVTGRSGTGYERRLACDRLFARRCSPGLYLRILFATVPAVLTARGAC